MTPNQVEFLKTMAIVVICIYAAIFAVDFFLNLKLKKVKRDIVMEKINGIVKVRYNNYQSEQFEYLRIVHQRMIDLIGPEKFLDFLIEQQRINPKPKYEIPLEVFNRYKATVQPLNFTPKTTTVETIDIDHEQL